MRTWQTGTAEEYAGRLASEARKYGIKAMVADPQDYDMKARGTLNSDTLTY